MYANCVPGLFSMFVGVRPPPSVQKVQMIWFQEHRVFIKTPWIPHIKTTCAANRDAPFWAQFSGCRWGGRGWCAERLFSKKDLKFQFCWNCLWAIAFGHKYRPWAFWNLVRNRWKKRKQAYKKNVVAVISQWKTYVSPKGWEPKRPIFRMTTS